MQSSEKARNMSTFFAIQLLDLFEKLSSTQALGNSAWTSHLHGALAISERCGDGVMESSTATRAFARLSTKLLISCLASGTLLPASFFRLRKYLEKNRYNVITESPK